MKSSVAGIIAFLAATISAAPCEYALGSSSLVLQLADNFSGANANERVNADGRDHSIANLFKNTPVDEKGQIMASSAQLVAFPQSVRCVLEEENGKRLGVLTAQNTYLNLNTHSSHPISLERAIIECTA